MASGCNSGDEAMSSLSRGKTQRWFISNQTGGYCLLAQTAKGMQCCLLKQTHPSLHPLVCGWKEVLDPRWMTAGLHQACYKAGKGWGERDWEAGRQMKSSTTHSFLIFRYTVNTGFKEACKHVPNAVWDIFMLNKYFVVYLHSKR